MLIFVLQYEADDVIYCREDCVRDIFLNVAGWLQGKILCYTAPVVGRGTLRTLVHLSLFCWSRYTSLLHSVSQFLTVLHSVARASTLPLLQHQQTQVWHQLVQNLAKPLIYQNVKQMTYLKYSEHM